MSQTIGPREQMLRDARAGELHVIPDFLDRTKGMTKEEIEAARDRATKRNNKASGRRLKMTPDERRSRVANLTEADKIAIAALKKAGADKVSVVRQVGAKLKSETKPKPKPTAPAAAQRGEPEMATKAKNVKTDKKTANVKAAAKTKKAAKKGVPATDIGDFICREGGASMAELVKKFGIEAHPMRAKIFYAKHTLGYSIESKDGRYAGTAPKPAKEAA